MMSLLCAAIFWAVNASRNEKSCLQFLIPTEFGEGGEGGVSHRLKMHSIYLTDQIYSIFEFSIVMNTQNTSMKLKMYNKLAVTQKFSTMYTASLILENHGET